MSVNIENEYGDIDIKNYEDVITSIVQASLEFVGCPYPCEVNVLLTDNDSIHEINNQQRNIDRATAFCDHETKSVVCAWLDCRNEGEFEAVVELMERNV